MLGRLIIQRKLTDTPSPIVAMRDNGRKRADESKLPGREPETEQKVRKQGLRRHPLRAESWTVDESLLHSRVFSHQSSKVQDTSPALAPFTSHLCKGNKKNCVRLMS